MGLTTVAMAVLALAASCSAYSAAKGSAYSRKACRACVEKTVQEWIVDDMCDAFPEESVEVGARCLQMMESVGMDGCKKECWADWCTTMGLALNNQCDTWELRSVVGEWCQEKRAGATGGRIYFCK